MSLARNLASNLRLLCSEHRSVAEICRGLGINRQQFNKYLAGTTMPSPHTLRRICAFFRVDETEILLAHEDFAAIVADGPAVRTQPALPLFAPSTEAVAARFPDSSKRLERYLGYYFVYYCSPAFPRMIIKALSQIIAKDGFVYDKTLERLVDRRHPMSRFSVCKYVGTVVHTDDRIYVAHFNSLGHQAMSFLAFYPSHRSHPQFLSGVFVSVSGGPGRQPFAARVVYEFLGRRTDLREAVAACGLYPEDAAEIDDEVRLRIRNTVPPGDNTLRAIEY